MPFVSDLQQSALQQTAVGPSGVPTASANARVALAHDYLLVMRGAERTFAAIAQLYEQAPILTLLYDEQGTGGRFAGRSIATSPLQRLGVGQGSFRRLLPLYPWAVRRLRVPACDAAAEQQQRVRPRRARPRGGAARVLLLHAVSLRLV